MHLPLLTHQVKISTLTHCFQIYSTVYVHVSFDGPNTIKSQYRIILAASANQQKLATHANSLLLTAILTHRARYRKHTGESVAGRFLGTRSTEGVTGEKTLRP